MQTSAAEETLERGVYKAPYKIDGCDVLFAITSRGERLKRILVLRQGVSESHAAAWLEQILDRLDPPRPALRLVTAPPSPANLTAERIDALYRDASPVASALWKRKRDQYRGNRAH